LEPDPRIKIFNCSESCMVKSRKCLSFLVSSITAGIQTLGSTQNNISV
jgi:hypothetical protein